MKKLQIRRTIKPLSMPHKQIIQPIKEELILMETPADIPTQEEPIPSITTPVVLNDEEIADIVDEEPAVPTKKEKPSKKREAKEENTEPKKEDNKEE